MVIVVVETVAEIQGEAEVDEIAVYGKRNDRHCYKGTV